MTRKILQTTHSDRGIAGGREVGVEFRIDDAVPVPATLLLPEAAEPTAAALLIHGFTSRKEQMTESVGRALLRRGLASLAVDLPLHGSRGEGAGWRGVRNPLEVLKHWRLAVRETALAARYLRARAEVDTARMAVVGYSLGSYLATQLAAADPAVRAVVVAAGGDLPADTPFAALARSVVDPLRAVRRMDGRPLLVVHGRRDRTVLPEQAERLFAAAPEPKEIRWWDAGHHLPAAAIDHAATWLVERLA